MKIEDFEISLILLIGNIANSQTKVCNCPHTQNSGDNVTGDKESLHFSDSIGNIAISKPKHHTPSAIKV